MTKCLHVLIFVILLSFRLTAQVTHASISQHEINIGERVTLSYSLPIKSEEPIFKACQNFLPVFKISADGKSEKAPMETVEILSAFRDTIVINKGVKMWTGYYEITVWDSGTYILPGPKIRQEKEVLQFPGVSFSGKLAPKVKGIDTYDIRESFAELPPKTLQEQVVSFLNTYGWLLISLLFVFLGSLFYRKRKRLSNGKDKELSLFEKTMVQLKELEQREPWKTGLIKVYYSQLSMLLRSYLSEVYQLQLLERTTSETLLLLERKVQLKELLASIKLLMETSDLVKFAKYHPNENAAKEHLDQCMNIITMIHEQTSSKDEQ
jgi:hypothetical protein